MQYEFYFDLEPVAKQSTKFRRMGKFVNTYTPDEQVMYEVRIRQMAQEFLALNYPGFLPYKPNVPLRVTKLQYVFTPTGGIMNRKKYADAMQHGIKIIKVTKPDVTDNLNKPLFDALAGVVYFNDAQIWKTCEVEKFYGLKRGIYLAFSDEIPLDAMF
jgi:Holliday junction resolvase RusA-like endonuclease